MAKQIKQFRWQAPTTEGINSSTDTEDAFVDGSIFEGCYPIKQLGIQTLPGVEFFLNENIYPIRIGASGIFDLDIEDETRIQKLNFSSKSIERLNTEGSYLIVDILHE